MQSLPGHPSAKSLNFSEPQEGCSRSEISKFFSVKGPIISILSFACHAVLAANYQLGLS